MKLLHLMLLTALAWPCPVLAQTNATSDLTTVLVSADRRCHDPASRDYTSEWCDGFRNATVYGAIVKSGPRARWTADADMPAQRSRGARHHSFLAPSATAPHDCRAKWSYLRCQAIASGHTAAVDLAQPLAD
ncbi:MAG: hypothetical protein WCC57_00800 [Paracoccaceae bacterium]